jgi:hypothetical protein
MTFLVRPKYVQFKKQRRYNSGDAKSFMVVRKRARKKGKEVVDAYDMLNDSPQPHCSAENDVSNLSRPN